jgi:type I restriction enzyme, R subunit
MAKGIHTEQTFEEAIENSLLEKGGYVRGFSKDFDVQIGMFPSYAIGFIQ